MWYDERSMGHLAAIFRIVCLTIGFDVNCLNNFFVSPTRRRLSESRTDAGSVVKRGLHQRILRWGLGTLG
jgi:hypothetical protein